MSQIQRIITVNPAANTDTMIYDSDTYLLASVIATNKETYPAAISVWVLDPATSQAGYLCKDLPLSENNTFETFRFTANPNDLIYVRSSTGQVSFILNGIDQLQ
jgi:hypothetical protein